MIICTKYNIFEIVFRRYIIHSAPWEWDQDMLSSFSVFSFLIYTVYIFFHIGFKLDL